MSQHQELPQSATNFGIFTGASLLLVTMFSLCPLLLRAQELPAAIGHIEGDNVQVKTPVGTRVEDHNAPTIVANGSEVTIGGQGLILLDGGGEISICGPAHFTLFKSVEAVTLALDYGRVHPSIDTSVTLTIFTPIVVATPVAIAGAPRDSTLGLDQHGAMCVLTERGAMHIQQQLSGQSLVVPQGGVVDFADGQVEPLHAAPGSCLCQYARGAVPEAVLPPPKQELAALSHPLQPERRPEISAPAMPPAEAPVYTVLMPPLSYDASSTTTPAEPSPESILLVRGVRMRPEVEFHGHVNAVVLAATLETAPASLPPDTDPLPAAAKVEPANSSTSFLAHLRNFFFFFHKKNSRST
jgi:hypothetical protein